VIFFVRVVASSPFTGAFVVAQRLGSIQHTLLFDVALPDVTHLNTQSAGAACVDCLTNCRRDTYRSAAKCKGVSLMQSSCEYAGCTESAKYGSFGDDAAARFCSIHRLPGMPDLLGISEASQHRDSSGSSNSRQLNAGMWPQPKIMELSLIQLM
jgi:hypothetical protein